MTRAKRQQFQVSERHRSFHYRIATDRSVRGQDVTLELQCQDIKQLGRIQSSFVKATNCQTWDDVCEKYPLFTSSDNLEPFKKLNFNQPTIPDDFMKYCQFAMKKEGADESTRSYDADDAVFVLKRGSAVGVFWKDVLCVSR